MLPAVGFLDLCEGSFQCNEFPQGRLMIHSTLCPQPPGSDLTHTAQQVFLDGFLGPPNKEAVSMAQRHLILYTKMGGELWGFPCL